MALDPASARAQVPDFLSTLNDGVAGLRIGVMAGWHEECADRLAPEVLASIAAASDALTAARAQVGTWRGSPIQDYLAVNRVILIAEAYTVHEQDFRTQPGIFGPYMRERLATLNPKASARVANRLIEASDRHFWSPDAATLAALHAASDDLEDRLEGITAVAA